MSLGLEHTHLGPVTASEKITDTGTSDGHFGAFAGFLALSTAAFALLNITSRWVTRLFVPFLGTEYGFVLKPPDRVSCAPKVQLRTYLSVL
jgi:hypothetical protein